MALAVTQITSGGGAAATSHTTASCTVQANGLSLLTVHLYASSGSAQPPAPTVSGHGRTWVQVGTDVIVDNSGSDRGTAFLFVATGASGASGTITITPSSSVKCSWTLAEATGADVSSGASSAIVQFVKSEQASVSAISTVLATMASSQNMAYGAVSSQSTVTKTWGNSWTRLGEVTTNSITYVGHAYFLGNTQLTQSVTWSTAGRTGAYAVEIKAGSSGLTQQKDDTANATDSVVVGGTAYNPYPAPIFAWPEPESHAHNQALCDTNGNLYKVLETPLALSNAPAMFKSTDNGATWAEVDSAHRPSSQDQEGSWVLQAPGVIYYIITRDDQVWFSQFNTSDNASNPDTWRLTETVDSGLSSSGMEQYSSATMNSDGTHWIFYSDNLSGANNQIAYRKRTGTNTYGTKVTNVGGSTDNWTGPASVMGASDTTHLIYKNSTTNVLWHRTLDSAGTLSSATQVATGTATDNLPHAAPVYYDDGGTEVIGVMWSDSANALKYRERRGGVWGTTETITTTPVKMDDANVTNGGTIGSIVAYGTTVYAAWVDNATGDIFRATRTNGVGWGSVSTVWNSGANLGYYCYVNAYPRAGRLWLGISFDVGVHANDAGDARYTVVDLGALGSSLTSNPADTANGTDSLSLVRGYGVEPFDQAGGTDALSRAAAMDRLLADGAGGTDSLSAQWDKAYSSSPADSAGGTDSLTAVLGKDVQLADSAAGSDLASPVQSMARLVAEAVGGTDSLSTSSTTSGASNPADTAGGTDVLTAGQDLVRGLADGAGATDSLTATTAGVYTASPSDTANGSDALTGALSAPRQVDDAAAATDGLSPQVDSSRTLADSAGATDSMSALKGGVVALGDSAGATDALGWVVQATVQLADSAAGSDSLSTGTASSGSASPNDPAGATDALQAGLDRPRDLADGAGGSDSLSAVLQRVTASSVDDGAVGADAQVWVVASVRPMADVAGASDSLAAVLAVALSRPLADSAAALDALVANLSVLPPGKPVQHPRLDTTGRRGTLRLQRRGTLSINGTGA